MKRFEVRIRRDGYTYTRCFCFNSRDELISFLNRIEDIEFYSILSEE